MSPIRIESLPRDWKLTQKMQNGERVSGLCGGEVDVPMDEVTTVEAGRLEAYGVWDSEGVLVGGLELNGASDGGKFIMSLPGDTKVREEKSKGEDKKVVDLGDIDDRMPIKLRFT